MSQSPDFSICFGMPRKPALEVPHNNALAMPHAGGADGGDSAVSDDCGAEVSWWRACQQGRGTALRALPAALTCSCGGSILYLSHSHRLMTMTMAHAGAGRERWWATLLLLLPPAAVTVSMRLYVSLLRPRSLLLLATLGGRLCLL